jgi:hypothetical protein
MIKACNTATPHYFHDTPKTTKPGSQEATGQMLQLESAQNRPLTILMTFRQKNVCRLAQGTLVQRDGSGRG